MKSISRVTRPKSQAIKNYDRLSRWYDWIAGSSEAKFRRAGVEMLDPRDGEKVLEIGFGTGHSLAFIGQAVGESGVVVGLDLSPGMIRMGKNRIAALQLMDSVALCQADGAYPPLKSNLFDAIFMSFTLELFDTPEIYQVLAQCDRLLMPDGRLVNVSLMKTSSPGLMERIYEWFHLRMPVVVDCRPIEATTALKSSGFEINQNSRQSMWGLAVEVVSASPGKA